MPNFDDISNNLRNRKATPPNGSANRPSLAKRTSRFEPVYSTTRKDGREAFLFGVDQLVGRVGWSISVAHAPANLEGTPLPQREIWLGTEQAVPLVDLLDQGIPMIQGRPSRPEGSPNSRESIGSVDDATGHKLHLVIQGYGTRWNLKIVGADDDWLPFDERDRDSLLEGLALAVARIKELDDDIPW